MPTTTALNDRAFTRLCWMIEQADSRISPDAVWLSGEPEVYEHLREIEALSLSNELAIDIACRGCGSESYRPVLNPMAVQAEHPYRGYCVECGWIDLRSAEARYWCVQPLKIARWLASALHLAPKYAVEPVIDGVLWRLGETEHRRKRRTLFFARRLAQSADAILKALAELATPGAEVIITTSDIASLKNSALGAYTLVPLRAVAHLRKAGFVVENIDSYLARPLALDESDETSLRPLRTQQAVFINGELISLPKSACQFLLVLDDADGDEVHKTHLAEAMGMTLDRFKPGDIFRRHTQVRDTFVVSDNNGRYRLKDAYRTQQEGGDG